MSTFWEKCYQLNEKNGRKRKKLKGKEKGWVGEGEIITVPSK